LNDPERAWRIWQILQAVDFHWLPDEIERQEAALVDDIMTIAFANGCVREMKQAEANNHG